MIHLAVSVAVVVVAVLAFVIIRRLRGKHCPECGAPRRLKGGSLAKFCPDCGHWFDKRLGA